MKPISSQWPASMTTGLSFPFDQTVGIPEHVGLDFIHVVLNPVPENLLHRLLVAGRTGGFGQGFQKFKGFGAHTMTSKYFGFK